MQRREWRRRCELTGLRGSLVVGLPLHPAWRRWHTNTEGSRFKRRHSKRPRGCRTEPRWERQTEKAEWKQSMSGLWTHRLGCVWGSAYGFRRRWRWAGSTGRRRTTSWAWKRKRGEKPNLGEHVATAILTKLLRQRFFLLLSVRLCHCIVLLHNNV